MSVRSILSGKSDQSLQDHCLQVDDDAFFGDETAIERGEQAVAEVSARRGRK